MNVFRRVILPSVWVIVAIVVAAALVKLAFFPADGENGAGADGYTPTGEVTEPQITVGRDTVRTDLELKATVQNDPAAEVKVQKVGNVIDVFATVGQTVTQGQVLASVREDVTNADGEVYPVWSEIVAPTAGTLSAFSALSGQAVAVADVVGAVAPASFRVQGTIAAEDRYKLLSEPTEAQIAITGGPAPFTCTDLVLETPLPGAASEDGTTTAASGDGTVTTTIRCSVPSDVQVFPGLAATMTIAGGLAENVLVAPVTAVLGSAESGVVFVPDADGNPVEQEVGLGLNDGTNVEITSGLDEGETIFEYAPGDEGDAGTSDGAGATDDATVEG